MTCSASPHYDLMGAVIMNKLVSLILVLLFATKSFADPLVSTAPRPCKDPTVDEIKIQLHQDSAEVPRPLMKPKPVIPIGCERPFIYRNEVFSTDSPQAQDAATLKYFVQSDPDAEKMLNDYQKNREKSRISAYTGTVGILLLVFAPMLSRTLFSSDSRDSAFKVMQLTGVTLAAGGFIYSFTLLRTNESLISKAVDSYNGKNKDDQIELKFTTGWKF